MDIFWLIDFYSYYAIIFFFILNSWLHLWQAYILYRKKSKQRWGVFIFAILYTILGMLSRLFPGTIVYTSGLIISCIGGVGLIYQWSKDEGSKVLRISILVLDIFVIILLIGQIFIF